MLPDQQVLIGNVLIALDLLGTFVFALGGAWTALFERRGARWVITQEHLSDRPAAQ